MAKYFWILTYFWASVPHYIDAESTFLFPGIRKRLELERQTAAAHQQAVPASQALAQSSSTSSERKDVSSPEHVEHPSVQVGGASWQNVDHAPVIVPPPMDVGAEGFPQLPAVDDMLSEATGTMKSVNSRTSALQAQLLQAQVASEGKLNKQKIVFESKLQEQEDKNRDIVKANAALSEEIERLQIRTKSIKSHAHALEEGNHMLSAELRALQGKLDIAKDFTTKSLESTQESNKKLLELLRVARPHQQSHKARTSDMSNRHNQPGSQPAMSLLLLSHRDHHASENADESVDGDSASDDSADGGGPHEPADTGLDKDLMDSMQKAKSSPSILLDILSKEVAQLAQQDKQSEAALKQTFVRDYRAGAQRRAALVEQQKALTAKKDSLLGLQSELETVVEHLKFVHSELERDIHGLGHFLMKLARFALAPKHDMPHSLEVLPTSVVVKVEK